MTSAEQAASPPEILEVQAGHNQNDPAADFFNDAARPTEQDPAVVAGCPEVIDEAVALARRCNPDIDETASAPIPPMRYTTTEGAVGLLRFTFELAGEHRAVGLNAEAPLPNGGTVRTWLYRVTDAGIWCKTVAGVKAGDQGDLNLFRIKVDEAREAAFPRQKPSAAPTLGTTAVAPNVAPPVQTVDIKGGNL